MNFSPAVYPHKLVAGRPKRTGGYCPLSEESRTRRERVTISASGPKATFDTAKAKRAYACSSPIEGSDKRRFFGVLHLPPITSPADAVRAAIVQEHRATGRGS
jgi:hypothetical protein